MSRKSSHCLPNLTGKVYPTVKDTLRLPQRDDIRMSDLPIVAGVVKWLHPISLMEDRNTNLLETTLVSTSKIMYLIMKNFILGDYYR